MANSGGNDSETPIEASDAYQEQEPNSSGSASGTSPTPSAASSLGAAAKSFESKFAARRKKRLEETAAAVSASEHASLPLSQGAGSSPSPHQSISGSTSGSTSGSSAGPSEPTSPTPTSFQFADDKKIDLEADARAKAFLTKLSSTKPSSSAEDTGDNPPLPSDSRVDTSLSKGRESKEPGAGEAPQKKQPLVGGKLGEEYDFGIAARLGAGAGAPGAAAGPGPGSGAAPGPSTPTGPSDAARPATPGGEAPARGGFKPRKDLSSYRSLDSKSWHGRPEGGSSALTGPGGSADAKLFGGMAAAPEEIVPDEPQTPEERKKALDAIGYKFGTDLPKEFSGGPAPTAAPVGNDQFKPPPPKPTPPPIPSDVGWQAVKQEEEPRAKAAFAAAKKTVLSPMEVAARKKEEAERGAAAAEKPKPYRGREEEQHIPKNRWGQAPETATARSVWAEQLGINKPSAALRGPSATLRGRLKRVMSADVFNVKELYSLRGVAAIIVFLAQAQIFAGLGKPAYPIDVIGAQIFFVMSGFVITRWLLVNETGSLLGTLRDFYTRRVLRIFPMYFLVLTILLSTGHLPNPESFFCGLFNLKAFDLVKVVPPQLLQYWTLCVEMQFYVLFPILLMVTPQRFRLILVILLTGATAVCTYMSAQATPHAHDWLLLPISGQYIMWGCLAAYMDVKSDVALSLNASMCVIVGILSQVALHAWLLVYGKVPVADVADILWKSFSALNAISLSILIFGLWRTSNTWLKQLCANDVLVYFGKISYGFYLLLPLCFFMQPAIIAVMPILTKVPPIATSFVINFVMAVISFHYLQVPINNFREHMPIAR